MSNIVNLEYRCVVGNELCDGEPRHIVMGRYDDELMAVALGERQPLFGGLLCNHHANRMADVAHAHWVTTRETHKASGRDQDEYLASPQYQIDVIRDAM